MKQAHNAQFKGFRKEMVSYRKEMVSYRGDKCDLQAQERRRENIKRQKWTEAK
jgi:predicted Ser/Thr protein kinase